MEAFYVSIIFIGSILVIAALFFIIMDKVNGKDFFKEFDRKKDEMFNLIQDSEEMIQELNKMSDYVVTVIEEKNKEFFSKNANLKVQKPQIAIEDVKEDIRELPPQTKGEQLLLDNQKSAKQEVLTENTLVEDEDSDNGVDYANHIEETEPQKVTVPINTKNAVLKYKNSGLQNKDKFSQNEDFELNMSSVVYEPQKSDKLVKDNFDNNRDKNKDKNGFKKYSELAQEEEISKDNRITDDKYLTEVNIEETQKAPDDSMNNGKEPENHEIENQKKSRLTLSGKRGEVLQLIEIGMSDDEISEKLKVGKGEVRLIRGLSK
ncbi:hypothetical protein [Ruminiclostridium herbifermentans]|uniref:hypothetical protein n=1 Tax=Ruminiclostridium herbifermentans TaxID=2488810 RepID=UPI001FD05A83|nr:hypothetical protein [Ruminiclostridium herbifermentans]